MTSHPKYILFEKWADIGFSWAEEVALQEFDRLYAHLSPTAQSQNPTLKLTISLSKKEGTVWFDATVQGVLWLDCHRCLDAINQIVDEQYKMAIVQKDSQLPALEQMQAEYVLWSEIRHDERMLPIFDMIEDELILSLPLSSVHEDCQMAVDGMGEITQETKENPFAILASLKTKN